MCHINEHYRRYCIAIQTRKSKQRFFVPGTMSSASYAWLSSGLVRLPSSEMSSIAKSDSIKLTPLVGGRVSDGVCSLLEIGGVRILLDCGCSTENDPLQLQQIAQDLKQIGGVHAVLLSHADFHHTGALPIVLGKLGLRDTPIICTSPVYKFGQIVLYDYILNKTMEGTEVARAYDFDDVDAAFSKPMTVKFNQIVVIPDREGIVRTGPQVSVCAVRSGRTIGGSVWRIRCGPTEILYMMDVNLKKEIILDGVNLDLLPASPALMIAEAGCASRSTNVVVGESARRSTKKEKDDNNALINTVMETMRAGGNVLMPMETAGRALEMMQVLGNYWYEHKLGLYHLIFLSHMAKNVPEFARMQLEWMSDSLSRGFYNGKPNPFDLPQIRFATSLKEIERFCPGPKVVLATDANLSSGLSKELLLKWGGDPRCRVIFIDGSDPGSLAAELRQKYTTPPVIATITRPVRVELSGAELQQYRAEQEKQRKLKEEALQRKRRQDELSMFAVSGDRVLVDDEDDSTGPAGGSAGTSATAGAAASSSMDVDGQEDATNARKKLKVDVMQRFLEPNFSMFETQETTYTIDEYGASIDDLQFRDIQSADTKWMIKDNKTGEPLKVNIPGGGTQASNSSGAAGSGAGSSTEEEEDNSPLIASDVLPSKLVSTTMRVQFTCEFKELNMSGRADLKAIKTLVSKVTPTRLLVLRGDDADSNAMLNYAKANGIEGYAPRNRSTVAFEVRSEKLKMQIPQSLLPASMKPVKVFSSAANGLVDTKCSVTALSGLLEESRAIQQEGTRLIKYQGAAVDTDGDGGDAQCQQDDQSLALRDQNVALTDSCIGVVSVGEVTLNSLRQLIEASGTTVEFRIDAQGAVLVCGDQVIIRKENLSDFAIEGPPVPAFYEARRALYQQFAFV